MRAAPTRPQPPRMVLCVCGHPFSNHPKGVPPNRAYLAVVEALGLRGFIPGALW